MTRFHQRLRQRLGDPEFAAGYEKWRANCNWLRR